MKKPLHPKKHLTSNFRKEKEMKKKILYQDIVIKKPIFSNYVGIYDKIIEKAITKNQLLRIKIPQGVGVHDPHQWKKTGKKIFKVFNYPNEPMCLWTNYVNFEKPKSELEELKFLAEQGVF